MAKKVTQKQRKQAIHKVENAASDNFNIKSAVPEGQLNLALEYISHGGNLVRKTKKQKVHDSARAKEILGKPAKLIDAVRMVLPAINTLQNSIVSQQQATNILVDVLKHHGYTKEDLFKAAKRVSKKASKHYQDMIHAYEKAYTKEAKGETKSSKKRDHK